MTTMDTELNLIVTAMRETLNTHCQVIYLHLKEYKNVEIAKVVPFTVRTFGTHIRNYKKYGSDGVTPRSKLGCLKNYLKNKKLY